jgi:hypothetical protein
MARGRRRGCRTSRRCARCGGKAREVNVKIEVELENAFNFELEFLDQLVPTSAWRLSAIR